MAASAAALAGRAAAAPLPSRSRSIAALYDRATVIDALASPSTTNVPYPPRGPLTAEQLANVRASGITAVNLTINEDGPHGGDAFTPTVRSIGFWQGQVDAHPDALIQVRTLDDLKRAKVQRKLGLIFGFQGADAIGADLRLLDTFQGLGVRIVQLTYNDRNRLGDGSMVAENRGLTPFGREVVARLNDLRVVVDLSHGGRRTTWEGLEASTRPPIISHTGARAIFDHPRNDDDRNLKACADKGGVVGVYLMPFLGGDPDRSTRALLLRHLDHVLKVCGEDHVGIGSDLSITPIVESPAYMKFVTEEQAHRHAAGISTPREDVPPYTPDLNTPRRLELVAEGLAERGHPERVIEKVLGANFERVFGEVWGRAPPVRST